MSEDAIKIFYSYSRKDLDMRNTLEDHLSALREAGRISTWHDLELEAGTEWEPAILNKLDTADIILLLVSRNFIASKYCYGTELKRAIARHAEGTAQIIPIILRPCDWNHSDVPFSKLNVLPTHAKPITSWVDQDEAFAIVAQRIRQTVAQLRAKKLSARQVAEQQLFAQEEAEQQAERERIKQEQQLEEQEQLRFKLLTQQEVETDERRRQQELERALERYHENAYRRQVVQPIGANELASDRGVDYTRLRDLLKVGDWKGADGETAARMYEVKGRQQTVCLRVGDIRNFPCIDLNTIDQLWINYSKGRFGFSVQKKIWQRHGSPTKYNNDWVSFGEVVGWKKKGFLNSNSDWVSYNNLSFDSFAPYGHLPLRVYLQHENTEYKFIGEIFGTLGCCVLFSRVKTCRL